MDCPAVPQARPAGDAASPAAAPRDRRRHRICRHDPETNLSEAEMFVSAMPFPTHRPIRPSAAGQNLQPGGQSATGAEQSGSAAAADDPVSAFTDLVKGTPEQRMFRMFLARHKLTEAQYAALSSDDQKKLQDEFKKETKEKTATGSKLDVVV
jgi:hypothetical protein